MSGEENVPPKPQWGGRDWETIDWGQWRGRVGGQIDLLIQAQLSITNHLYKIEKELGQRDQRVAFIGLGAGAIGGTVMALVWLVFRLATHQ